MHRPSVLQTQQNFAGIKHEKESSKQVADHQVVEAPPSCPNDRASPSHPLPLQSLPDIPIRRILPDLLLLLFHKSPVEIRIIVNVCR
jgi:hypothetical protein